MMRWSQQLVHKNTDDQVALFVEKTTIAGCLAPILLLMHLSFLASSLMFGWCFTQVIIQQRSSILVFACAEKTRCWVFVGRGGMEKSCKVVEEAVVAVEFQIWVRFCCLLLISTVRASLFNWCCCYVGRRKTFVSSHTQKEDNACSKRHRRATLISIGLSLLFLHWFVVISFLTLYVRIIPSTWANNICTWD